VYPLSAASKLLSELKERFPQKTLEPYGPCLPIPGDVYRKEWTSQLEAEGCKILSQSYEGEVYYFVRVPQPRSNHADNPQGPKRLWTHEEEAQLKDMHSQGLSVSDIAQKLNRPIGSIESKRLRLGLLKEANSLHNVPELDNHVESSALPSKEAQTVKEFLSAASLLYPSHRQACAYLLKEVSTKILNEA
jgi:hypothetical protein